MTGSQNFQNVAAPFEKKRRHLLRRVECRASYEIRSFRKLLEDVGETADRKDNNIVLAGGNGLDAQLTVFYWPKNVFEVATPRYDIAFNDLRGLDRANSPANIRTRLNR